MGGACNSRSNTNKKTESKQKGKSISEQLKSIPYRNEEIADEITNLITTNIQAVIDQTETLNEVTIYYVTSQGQLNKVDGEWRNGTSAIKYADELWRSKQMILTIVAYPSFSQNATTGVTKELWVIEANHRFVSRTCKMFFNAPKPTELTELDCLRIRGA